MHFARLPQRTAALLGLAALLAVAAGLRLWRLASLPAGLHFDEAAHGLLVQDTIFRGRLPVFFSNYTGHEALYHYTLAPFLALLGPTALAARLPAASWSIATVAVVYGLGATMWDRRTGLLAALAAACGGWLVHIGRIGFRANTLPVVAGLAVLFLYHALTRNRRRDWLLAGALFGLSLYTYLAARLLPLAAPLLLLYLAIWHRPVLRSSARGLVYFCAALLLVTTPLAYHMWRVPGDFWERFEQIAVAGAAQGTRQPLWGNLWRTLGMFGVRGAANGFFNLPGRPVFPGLLALPFYCGVLLSLWQWHRFASALTLLWLAMLLLPTVLAADAPHWLRAIGAAPPTYLLWGLGAATACDWLARRWRWGAIAAAAAVLVVGAWWTQATAREYFGVWASRAELYYDYMEYAVDAAHEAQRTAAGHALLISEDYYRHATYLYLAPRSRSAQWYDARHAVVWPRSAPWTAIVSTSTPTTPDVEPLLAHARGEPYAPDGLFAFIRLEGDSLPPWQPPNPVDVTVGDRLKLEGYALEGAATAGARLHLRLFCRAIASPGRELRLFVHVEDESGRVLAQDDVLGYDAREWRPDDRFISFHDLQLPDTLPYGKLRLVAGLYDAVTGERFPVAGTALDYVELPMTR